MRLSPPRQPTVAVILAALTLCAGAASPVAAPAPAPAPAPARSPGDVISVQLSGTARPGQIRQICAPLFEGYGIPPFRHGVDYFILRFESRDADDSPVQITAMLLVPRLPAPAPRPVLVFGAGTTGLADECAPSLEQSGQRYLGRYRENMLAYAGMGFITVLPDYAGFNDPARPQRYFSSRAEAHVMLDAARAVSRVMAGSRHPVSPMPVVFTAGYSQGGHAAFAAADLRPEYAPEVPLAGVIGFGSTNDVEALLREGVCYAPSILYTYRQLYGDEIDPAACLQEKWVRTLEADVTSQCVDVFQKYYGFDAAKMFKPGFLAALRAGTLAEGYPRLAARLAENHSGLSGHGLPALVVQGGADFIVTSATQMRFAEALRAAGSTVVYREYPGVPHKGTRQAGFMQSVDWMEGLARRDARPAD